MSCPRLYGILMLCSTLLATACGIVAVIATLPIAAAGFCWGGKHLLLLGAETEEVDGKPLFEVGYAAHPSFVEFPGEFERLVRPVSFAIGDKDNQVPLEQAMKVKEIVEAKPEGQTGELVIYEGCSHGFAVRADPSYADLSKQVEAAENQAIHWFDTHLGLSSTS